VPADTQLSAVTAADRQKLCDFAEAQMDVSKEDACKATGVAMAAFGMVGGSATDATLQAACKAAYDSCMQSSGTTSGESTCNTTTPIEGTCTATVGELESCMKDEAAQAKSAMAAMPSCDKLTVSSLADLGSISTETPASCNTVNTKCPGVGELTGDDTSGGDDISSGDFTCADGTDTVPSMFKCDGENDCADGSDEANCT